MIQVMTATNADKERQSPVTTDNPRPTASPLCFAPGAEGDAPAGPRGPCGAYGEGA
jgi:hypothetical protein